MKQITSPGSMRETGCSGLVHWDDPEGWDGDPLEEDMATHSGILAWKNPHGQRSLMGNNP